MYHYLSEVADVSATTGLKKIGPKKVCEESDSKQVSHVKYFKN
jgi:hypothetical protein